MDVQIQWYSGYKAHEYPLSFTLNGRKFTVEEILDRWYGVDYLHFKLKADDKNVYILKYDEAREAATLELFQSGSQI